jgi:aldose 1-epimerase
MHTTPALDPRRFEASVAGRPVRLYRLSNRHGMEVAITNLGAKILQLLAPDRHGVLGDVVLGYDSLPALQAGAPSMGAFIGRYAGRISQARFDWDGVPHALQANAGPHSIHGGPAGLRFQVLNAEQPGAQTLALTHRFEQAADGFPGNMDLRLVYRLTDDNELVVEHEASMTEGSSPASFTCHAFFNLDGPGSDINGQHLQLNSRELLATDGDNVPTGALHSLHGHALDLRSPQQLGALPDIDHAYVLAAGDGPAARLVAPQNGRTLEVWTGEPVLQVYGAGQLGNSDVPDTGKGGAVHRPRAAICLEAQQYPNAVNCPGFPQNRVSPERPYRAVTRYRFGVVA